MKNGERNKLVCTLMTNFMSIFRKKSCYVTVLGMRHHKVINLLNWNAMLIQALSLHLKIFPCHRLAMLIMRDTALISNNIAVK